MASNLIKLSILVFLAMMITHTSQAQLGQLKETKMSMYIQDVSGGPNATSVQVTMHRPNEPLNFTKFGAIFVTDGPITERFEANSTQVGRAQGMYATSSLDGSNSHVSSSIVFTNEKYNGSTLEMQGTIPQFEPLVEVAIVGGTGKLRLARGYATFETLYYDPTIYYAVIRCNVTALHY